ncbi:VanZ like protein [Dyadobacter jejuensis]|uniref:VanZ like protein n=1 Tax=Dyadobacter jejuensis TaxID=1082580 RepID=A0A316AM77_9BACT|nr:VanZ family protein [Dyadobacter jejuensis]PWJ58843.1 VanZ like protein [Dyadobacter jejuensis]
MLKNFVSYLQQHSWVALLWTILVYLSCNWPASDIPHNPTPGFDKLVHVIFFAVGVSLWLFRTKMSFYKMFVYSFLFGLSIEISQWLLPFNRSFDWWDVLADTTGTLMAFLIYTAMVKYYLQRLY